MIGLLKRHSARKIPATTAAALGSRPKSPSDGINLQVYKNNTALDAAGDVRLALAGRLVTLLPTLNAEKHAHVYAYTVQALGNLALDEVLKVRSVLSGVLRDHGFVPPKIAQGIVQSLERDITVPVLRFCTSLSDQDLLEIIRLHPSLCVEASMKKTPPLAAITTDGLVEIVRKARSYPEHTIPTPSRISLPTAQALELAALVDASIYDVLINHNDFDRRIAEDILIVFRRRLNRSKDDRLPDKIDDEMLGDALALRKVGWIYEGLARVLRQDSKRVKKIFETQSAKSIVALCWKAGLSMRTALMLQRDLALIPASRLIYPKGGTDYPMTESELRWQLEFLGFSKP